MNASIAGKYLGYRRRKSFIAAATLSGRLS
jgi:hypothetical protein